MTEFPDRELILAVAHSVAIVLRHEPERTQGIIDSTNIFELCDALNIPAKMELGKTAEFLKKRYND